MHKKLSLIAAALAVTACLGASSASAATLYTTAAHTTPVAVNSTFTATTPAPEAYNVLWYNTSGNLIQACSTASYSFKVMQNSAGVFKANVTASSYAPGCIGAVGDPIGQPTGNLQVSGSSVANGSNTAWLGSTLKEVSWKDAFTNTGNYTSATGSPPAKGVFTQQPTAAKVPVSVVLDRAEKWTGWSTGTFSATYTFTGAAASWSFG